MVLKGLLVLGQRKQKQFSWDVRRTKNTTSRVSISLAAKKNSRSTRSASTSGAKKKTSGPLLWTPARKHSFIVSVLRTGTRRWPPKYEVLNESKTEKKINVKTGRLAQHFLCAACADEFPATGVQVDHISPVVGSSGFTTWDDYINNMYCEKDNLQVLCLDCHKIKTKEEREVQNKNRS